MAPRRRAGESARHRYTVTRLKPGGGTRKVIRSLRGNRTTTSQIERRASGRVPSSGLERVSFQRGTHVCRGHVREAASPLPPPAVTGSHACLSLSGFGGRVGVLLTPERTLPKRFAFTPPSSRLGACRSLPGRAFRTLCSSRASFLFTHCTVSRPTGRAGVFVLALAGGAVASGRLGAGSPRCPVIRRHQAPSDMPAS